VVLSAEPLVGLKLVFDFEDGHCDRLSAEPLVGLKRDSDVGPTGNWLGFQPNPSWV